MPFKAATSGERGVLVTLDTDKGVSYVAKARSIDDLHSIKQGDRVFVFRNGGQIHIKRASPAQTVSLPLIRIDPCPPGSGGLSAVILGRRNSEGLSAYPQWWE